MEFQNLGQHCSVPTCKVKDFLPFNCIGCEKIFCVDHREGWNHECDRWADIGSVFVLICPLCNMKIKMSATEDPNQVLHKHETSGNCNPEPRTKTKKVTCFACSTIVTEVNSVSCSKCLQRVCIKHWAMVDHDCLGRPPSKLLGMSNRNWSDFENWEKPG